MRVRHWAVFGLLAMAACREIVSVAPDAKPSELVSIRPLVNGELVPPNTRLEINAAGLGPPSNFRAIARVDAPDGYANPIELPADQTVQVWITDLSGRQTLLVSEPLRLQGPKVDVHFAASELAIAVAGIPDCAFTAPSRWLSLSLTLPRSYEDVDFWATLYLQSQSAGSMLVNSGATANLSLHASCGQEWVADWPLGSVLADGSSHEFFVTPQSGALELRLAGNPLPDTDLRISWWAGDTYVETIASSQNGFVSLWAPDAQALVHLSPLRSNANFLQTRRTIVWPANSTPILELGTHRIDLSVRDGSDRPFPDASIQFERPSVGIYEFRRADLDGNFTIYLASGSYWISAESANDQYSASTRYYDIFADGSITLTLDRSD